MKELLKGKILWVLAIAALVLGATAVLGLAITTAQGALGREVVTRQVSGNNAGDEDELPAFPVSESVQLYGSGGFGGAGDSGESNPDLLLAVGIDGTIGFVLRDDLYSGGPLGRPQNPAEAALYQAAMEQLAAEARARGEWFIYTIPLYDSDGRTVIGEFGVGNSGYYQGPPPDQGSQHVEAGDYLHAAADVQSVYIVYGERGRTMTDVSVVVGERVPLRVRIEPIGAGIEEGIVWTSSNRNVFDVVPTCPEGRNAAITGIGHGTATLTVSVNGVEAECTIRVRR
jgi:hypothetical protein